LMEESRTCGVPPEASLEDVERRIVEGGIRLEDSVDRSRESTAHMRDDVVYVGKVVDGLSECEVHEGTGGLEVKFDLAGDVWCRIGLD